MINDLGKVAQETIDAINEKIRNLSTLNIIVAGKTGVGKSTLINAVFKDELAETGMGRPVTDHMRKITKKDIPWLVDNVYVVAAGNIANTVAKVSRNDIEVLYKKML